MIETNKANQPQDISPNDESYPERLLSEAFEFQFTKTTNTATNTIKL